MADVNNTQAAFMENMNALKEYAKVNGGIITKEDVINYFKDIELDDQKLQMIYGYLMANNIKVQGELNVDNQFLKLMESAVEKDKVNAGEEPDQKDAIDTDIEQASDESNKNTKVHNYNPEDEAQDQKYIEIYLEDLSHMEKMSDTSRAFLLMNIVEDNDKESLKLLSESFLDAIVQWVEPYRNKGILVSDLIQEGNLSMMAYMNSKRWLNHADWKEKIKEGTTNDLLNVLKLIEDNLKDEVVGSIQMIIDEQMDSDKISNKVLNKVNLVYDWAKRLKTELGRKPKVQELADRMGISADNIREAIQLSAEAIEDIDMK